MVIKLMLLKKNCLKKLFTSSKKPLLSLFLLIFYILFLFTLNTSAAITIQGDIPKNIFVAGYATISGTTNAPSNPCSGTDANGTANGTTDVAYDDNDDYSLSLTVSGGSSYDLNVWFCSGLNGTKYSNYARSGVSDGSSFTVDLGQVSGDTNAALDQDYVFVCDDVNGNKLNSQLVQVDTAQATDFTQYYAFEDSNAWNDEIFVFFDNDALNGCTLDRTKTAGRIIKTTSSAASENFGVSASFNPQQFVDGNLHADWVDGLATIVDDSNFMRGLAKIGDINPTNATDYNLYYDDPTSGTLTLNLYKKKLVLGEPDQNISGLSSSVQRQDAEIKISGKVPSDITSVDTEISSIRYTTFALTGTPQDYNLYIDSGQTPVIDFNVASAKKAFSFDYNVAIINDNSLNIGKVAGETHSSLESPANSDSVEVYINNTCSDLATRALSGQQPSDNGAFNGTDDYNLYFADDATTYYLKTTYNPSGTSYTACGNAFTLSNQEASVDLLTQLGGNTDGNVTVVGADLQSGGNGTSDINATVNNGQFYLFVGTGSNSIIAGQNDSNVIAFDSKGTILLERTKDLLNTSDANVTFNIGHLEGEAHSELETNANDLFSVFSDTGCTTTLTSSPGIGANNAGARDYNVFFEADATNPNDTNYYLLIQDVNGANTFSTCGNRFTLTNYNNPTHNIDRQITGLVNSDILKVGVDWTTANGIDDANTTDIVSNRYWLFTSSNLAGATADMTFYRAPAYTLALTKSKDLSAADQNVTVAKVSGEAHSLLESGNDDTIHVFSTFNAGTGAISTKLSSVDFNPADGTADDFNQYYEPTKGYDGNKVYYLRVRFSDGLTTFDTNGLEFVPGASLSTTVNITVDVNGVVVPDIARAGLDLNQDGTAEAWTEVKNNKYNLFSTIDSTSTDLNFYKSSGNSVLNETINIATAGTKNVNVSQLTGKLPQAFQGDTQFLDKTSVFDATCSQSDKNSYLAAETNGDYNLYFVAGGQDYNALICNGSTLEVTFKFTSDSTGNVIHTRNIAGVGGEAHSALETDVLSSVYVYKSANCTNQVSTATVNPSNNAANDYNVYFDANNGAGATYYLRVLQWGENATCQSFTGGNPTSFKQHDLSVQLSGVVPENIARITVDSNGAFTTDFNANDSNRFYMYFTPETSSTLVQALADSSTVLLARNVNLTTDYNFNVGRIKGTGHADLNNQVGDNLEVYSAPNCAIGNKRSSQDINFPNDSNYNQFFEANFDGNIYVKVINNNGSVDQNTCINTGVVNAKGITASFDLNRRIQGIVGGNITRVNAIFNGSTFSPDANITPTESYLPDAYTMYLPSNGDVNVRFYDGTGTLVMNKAMDASSDINVDVGFASGNVHQNAVSGGDDTVEVFSDTGCNNTITAVIATVSDSSGNGTRDYNVYFDLNGLTTFYAKLVKDGAKDFNTCLASGFSLTDLNNTSVDFDRQIAGIVPYRNSSNAISKKITTVGIDLGADGTIDINGDINGNSYYLFADSDIATGDANIIFFSDGGVTPELMRTKNVSSDINLHVNGVYGETHPALEDGTDSIEVCKNLPGLADKGNCTVISSKNVHPSASGGNDYEIYYDVNSANDTYYWLQIKDVNSDRSATYVSYHKVIPVSNGGTVTDVNLDELLNGTVVEDFNTDANIADVNVQVGKGTGSGSSADIAIADLNATTFTDSSGYFGIFTALVTPANDGDMLFEKGGYITESFDNNSDLANISNGKQMIVPLSSGIEIQLKDKGGNLITDAKVTILDSKNPDIVLTGCSNPVGDCKRDTNNASNGRYIFSGFTLPATIAIKIEKTGFETIVDPAEGGKYYTVTTTQALDKNYTLTDRPPQAVSLASPSNGATVSNRLAFNLSWYDLNVDEIDYNIQLGTNPTFTTGVVVDTNSNGGNVLTYTINADTLGPDGTVYYWRVRARDNTGWGDWSETRSFTLDTNAPTGLSMTINDNAAYTNTLAVILSVTATDASKCVFANDTDMDNSATDENFSNEFDYNNSISWNLDGNTNGVKRVFMQCRNDANEWAGPVSDTIIVDAIAPTGASITIEDGNQYTNHNTNIKIDLNVSGASVCQLSNNESTWTTVACNGTVTDWNLTGGDGLKTVYFRAQDVADNNTIVSDTIVLDTTAPVITGKLTATQIVNGTGVKLEWGPATDTGSGVDYYTVYASKTSGFNPNTPLAIVKNSTVFSHFPNTTGTWYYIVRATDRAGNQDNNTTEVSILVDVSAPNAVQVTIDNDALYTNTRSVTATFRATDDNAIKECWWSNKFTHTNSDWNKISGLDTANYLASVSVTLGDSGDGNKYVFLKCTDYADQNSGEVYDIITLDSTPPTTPVATKPTSDVNAGESFTWDWNASTDATSGIDYYLLHLTRNGLAYRDDQNTQNTYYTYTNLSDGAYVLSVTPIDKAGNSGTTLTFSTVTVDTDLPGILSFTPTSNTDTNDTTPTYTVTADGETVACKFTYTFNGTAYQNITTPTTSVCSFTVPSGLLSDTNTITVSAWVQDQAGRDRNDWNGPFTLPTYTIDTTIPTVTILTPTQDQNTSDTTPLIKFTVQDNAAGTGISLNDINVSINGASVGFNSATHCTDVNNTGGRAYLCEFSSSTLTDPTNDANLYIQVLDKAGNHGQKAITFNVDGNNYITVNSLTATRTSGVADNTFANGWQFDFNLEIGTTAGTKVRFKLDDWVSGSNTIDVNGTTTRIMYDANINGTKTTEIYNVKNSYDLTQDVNSLWDANPNTSAIDANIILQQKIPSNTIAGQYKTKYFIRTYS